MNARKKTKSPLETFFIIIVLPLLLVNIWAIWRILQLAKALEIPMFGSVHAGPTQLAGLLLVNIVIIVLLTMRK
jgi:hypothetical protein